MRVRAYVEQTFIFLRFQASEKQSRERRTQTKNELNKCKTKEARNYLTLHQVTFYALRFHSGAPYTHTYTTHTHTHTHTLKSPTRGECRNQGPLYTEPKAITLKPGVYQNTALHASPTTTNSASLISAFPVPSASFFLTNPRKCYVS